MRRPRPLLYIARQIGNREGSSAKMGNKEIGGHCLLFKLPPNIYLLDIYSPVFLVNGFPRGSL